MKITISLDSEAYTVAQAAVGSAAGSGDCFVLDSKTGTVDKSEPTLSSSDLQLLPLCMVLLPLLATAPG